MEGVHAVRELLAAGRRPVAELFVDVERREDLAELLALADDAHVPIRVLGRAELAGRARSEVHQGVVARAAPLAFAELAELAAAPGAFLLVVDGVTDPHNLGALLRSAQGAGVTGVVLARHRAAGITPTVAKAAAGAIEHLALARVAGIPAALGELRAAGIWTVGLDAAGDVDLEEVAVLVDPVALVLGAEGRGLSPLALERCEVLAHIPLLGGLESLNVAAAGAVALFTVARHRAHATGSGARRS